MKYKKGAHKSLITEDNRFSIHRHWSGGYVVFCREHGCLLTRGRDIEIYGRQKDAKRAIEKYLY